MAISTSAHPYRRAAWKETILTSTLWLLAITEAVWLVVASIYTPWFLRSGYGAIFMALFSWVVLAAAFPRLPLGLRIGAVVTFLGVNIGIGFVLAGPNPGNTSLVLMLVVFAALFWSLRQSIAILVLVLLAVGAAAIGWSKGLFPLGGIAPNLDPRQPVTWIRGAMAMANGSLALAIVVSVVIGQLARAADQAEAALQREKESEIRVRDMFERLPLGVYRTSVDGRVLAANQALARLLGFDRVEDLLALNLESDLYQPSYDRCAFKARIEKEGEIRGDEAVWRRRDGSNIFVRENARAVRDSSGAVLYYEGVIEDITERKALEEQLRGAQRLEAIGTLASGIAHDLNNILTPMLMASQLLETQVTGEQRDLATLVKSGAERGTGIIRKLLAFGRGSPAEATAMSPIPILKEIAAITRATFPRAIEIVERHAPDLPSVNADSTQLHQILMNLCVNARDAMPNGGRLAIGGERASVDAALAEKFSWAKPGPHVVLSVEDTGSGIPPEIRARIFEPFFTTKGVGHGTGLGLWSAHTIIKGRGGFVTVDCPPAGGTSFRVYLPVAGAPARSVAEPIVQAARSGHGRTILVVDDEAPILMATRKALETGGFRVLTAEGGAEAEKLVAKQPDAIHLVITDQMMPGMDGATVMVRLRRLSPSLKFIAVSGLDQTLQQDSAGFDERLLKPYEVRTLLDAVHRVLS